MTTQGRTVGTLLVVVLALLGCSAAPTSSPAEPEARSASARLGEFTLVVTSPKATWQTTETINVQAVLAYDGAPLVATVFGPGGGLIGFSVDEVGGSRKMDGIWHLSCMRYSIDRGQPVTAPYRKSVSFGEGEPNEAFYRQFWADPLFHLPIGSWRITAFASFATGAGCAAIQKIDLHPSFLISVE